MTTRPWRQPRRRHPSARPPVGRRHRRAGWPRGLRDGRARPQAGGRSAARRRQRRRAAGRRHERARHPHRLHVIRAFSWFSLLANIAEDVTITPTPAPPSRIGSPPQAGTIAHAARRRSPSAGCQPDRSRRPCSHRVEVSPVLTAHPTEVRRKTILDTQRRIADAAATSATALLAGRRRAAASGKPSCGCRC